MELGYTIHSIHRGKEVLPVGTVVEFSDTDCTDLANIGAIREPTEAEVKLYLLSNPVEKKPAGKAAKSALKQDGPTVAEFVAAGYAASAYPPSGYASRSTAEEIAAAVAAEKPVAPAPVDPEVVDAPLV